MGCPGMLWMSRLCRQPLVGWGPGQTDLVAVNPALAGGSI